MATTDYPSPLAQHTAFQRDLLAVIERLNVERENRPYGLAIKSRLEDAWGEEVNHGRLYPNLDALVDGDLVEKDSRDGRTNTYALTERGRAALESDRAWRS